jgi:CRISPR-associated protein Csx16
MRLVTFLGTGKYSTTNYIHPNGEAVSTAYVAHAIARLWPVDEVIALCTEEAEQAHGQGLIEALEGQPTPILRRFPFGRTESELWEQFDILRDALSGADALVVDITHGFRSQPFFAAGALTYLKMLGTLPNQNLEVVYGRFLPTEPEESPIWDLTPFLDLLDWAQGAALLVETGQADHLIQVAERMDQAHRRALASQGSRRFPPTNKLVKALREFTDDIATVRIANLTTGYAQDTKAKARVQGSAARLITILQETRASLASVMPALGPILDRVSQVAAGLPTDTLAGASGQDALSTLALRYLDYRRYPEAAIVLREALLSRYAQAAAVTDINASDFDDKRRRALDHEWGCRDPVARTIADVRNDLEHGGFRRQPIPGATLKERLRELVLEHLSKDPELTTATKQPHGGTTYFVTRHPGAREWAATEGIKVDHVIEHLDIDRITAGDTVIGTLPINLAADLCRRCATYLHLSLSLPPELRGRELTAEQMRELGARVERFLVSRAPS